MRPKYAFPVAKRIARRLVEHYPTHGFIIDREETEEFVAVSESEKFGLGLEVTKPSAEIASIFDDMQDYLDEITVIGRIQEVEQ
jgi:hypothetical protein